MNAPGAATRAAGALPPGTAVGRYTVVREIGRGGMGRVYEAVHNDLQKTVALKVLGAQHMDNPVVVERFLREGRNASRVRHRHAIEVFDVGQQDGVVFLAMEHLQGEDLAQRLHREGPLPATACVDLLLPAIAALAEAHDVGVIHRDLKPGNLFLAVDRRGRPEVRVLDFGIAKAVDERDREHHTHVGVVIGTALYLAPELVRGAQHASPASDQYALGVILYQCTSGQVPFRGRTPFETCELIVRGDHTPLRLHAPALPDGFDLVVARAMSLDPAARFPSLVELGAALLPFASFAAQVQWSSAFGVEPAGVPPALLSSPPPPPAPSGAFSAAPISDPGAYAPPSLADAAMTPAVTTRDVPIRAPRPPRSRTLALAAAGALTLVALLVLTVAIQHAARIPAAAARPATMHRPAPPPAAPPEAAAQPAVPPPTEPAAAQPTEPAAQPAEPAAQPAAPVEPAAPVVQSLQSPPEANPRRHHRERVRRNVPTEPARRRPGAHVERTQGGGFIIR